MARRAIVPALLGAAGLALYLWPAIVAPVVRWSDSDIDLAWAKQGSGIFTPIWTFGHAAKPGYLLFLRGALAVSGGRPRGVIIAQSLLLCASIGVSALLLSRRRGRGVAFAFAIAAMLFLRIRDASSAVMSETLSAALFLPLAVLVLDPPGRTALFSLIGVLLGALFLVRPNVGASALVLIAVSCVFRNRWRAFATAVLVMAAIVALFWIATAPGHSGDRARGLTFQIFEGSADDYWFPSIAPAPDQGTPAQISRELSRRALENWRKTLARSGPDARRQFAWRALHGLLGAEFYDARWSRTYEWMTSVSRLLSPLAVLACVALLLVLPITGEDRVLQACGLLLTAMIVGQDLVLGSNPRYALPFLPVLLMFAVCAAVRASAPRALAAVAAWLLLCVLVGRQKSALSQEWGVLEASGVSLSQPIPQAALPERAPATLHVRIAAPLLPADAGLEVHDPAGRLLYSSVGDASRQRPEITIALPQGLLDESRRTRVWLRLTATGSYDSLHYLLFPVIPSPWSAQAKREGSAILSPASGTPCGSLDWWAHDGVDQDRGSR